MKDTKSLDSGQNEGAKGKVGLAGEPQAKAACQLVWWMPYKLRPTVSWRELRAPQFKVLNQEKGVISKLMNPSFVLWATGHSLR